jgi:Protein of unknown function (DUF935).
MEPQAKPISGKIAAAVEDLAGKLVEQIGVPERIDLDALFAMLSQHPVASAAHTLSVLQLIERIGDWHHPDTDIQAFIDHNWSQMDGSLVGAFVQMSVAKSCGYAVVERSLRPRKGSEPWLLESLILVPPKNFQFEGQYGKITGILYKPSEGDEVSIPMDRLLHIVNRPEVALLGPASPYGVGDCGLASTAWEAWRIMMSQWTLAGQRQATPLIHGTEEDTITEQRDSRGAVILGPDGNPLMLSGPDRLRGELQKINQNGGVITTSLNGRVQAIQNQTDGRFFEAFLHYLDKLIAKAFLVPYTALEEGQASFGNAGLAQVQQQIMAQTLQGLADQMQDQILEQVIRPLIFWQFGPQETYGSWVRAKDKETAEERTARIAELDSLSRAFATGVYSTADLDAVNRHRELARIPTLDSIQAAVFSLNRRYWRTA